MWVVLLKRSPVCRCSGPGRLQVERQDEAADGGDVRSRALPQTVGGLGGGNVGVHAEARR